MAMFSFSGGSLRFTIAVIIAMTGGESTVAAATMKKTDVAGTIAYLLRIQHGLCPGIKFDPFEMSKMIDPKGVPLTVLKRKYKADFDESYSEAGSRIDSEGAPAFCDLIRSMFHSNVDAFPGLIFR
jgi:hypothetical protein